MSDVYLPDKNNTGMNQIDRVGKDGEPQKTKAVAGKLNPVFPKGTSTFTFDVGSLRFDFNDFTKILIQDLSSSPSFFSIQVEDPTKRRIFFEVMDKDTFTKDDLIGKVIFSLNLLQRLALCSRHKSLLKHTLWRRQIGRWVGGQVCRTYIEDTQVGFLVRSCPPSTNRYKYKVK